MTSLPQGPALIDLGLRGSGCGDAASPGSYLDENSGPCSEFAFTLLGSNAGPYNGVTCNGTSVLQSCDETSPCSQRSIAQILVDAVCLAPVVPPVAARPVGATVVPVAVPVALRGPIAIRGCTAGGAAPPDRAVPPGWEVLIIRRQ